MWDIGVPDDETEYPMFWALWHQTFDPPQFPDLQDLAKAMTATVRAILSEHESNPSLVEAGRRDTAHGEVIELTYEGRHELMNRFGHPVARPGKFEH